MFCSAITIKPTYPKTLFLIFELHWSSQIQAQTELVKMLAFLVIILEFIANTQYLVCFGTKYTNFGMFYTGIFYVQTDCNRKPSPVSVDPSRTAQENNGVQGEGGQSVLLCQ